MNRTARPVTDPRATSQGARAAHAAGSAGAARGARGAGGAGRSRAFTLIELVVVVVVLAVLGALASLALNRYVDDAEDTRTRENLRVVSKTLTVGVLQSDAEVVTSADVDAAIARLFPAPAVALPRSAGGPGGSWATGSSVDLAAGGGYTLLGPDEVPASDREFSVGFDDGDDTTADVSGGDGAAGTRVSIVTQSPTGRFYGAVVTANEAGRIDQVSGNGDISSSCLLYGTCALGDQAPEEPPGPCPMPTKPQTITVSARSFFDLDRETRLKGHYAFTGTGLHINTESKTTLDKVAGYRTACAVRLDTVGNPTLNYVNNSGVAASYQLYVDNGKPGAAHVTGYVVGEPGPYGINWWSTKNFGVGSGMGYASYAPLAKYIAKNPDAAVSEFGFALGSGVKGDGVLKSLTFAGLTYTFK